MLRQRVITALVLVTLLLGSLLAASAWPFALLALVLIAAAGWEWGRLNQAGATLALAMARRWRWLAHWPWPAAGTSGPPMPSGGA